MGDTKGKVYIITGPTAVGKSAIAFYLAKRLNGEIINCDSVQLYKFLDIGSAKPSTEEMSKVPHHLYSIINPNYKMTAAKYQQLSRAVIDNVLSRGKTPIVVGGTGLYLNTLIYNMEFAGRMDDDGKRRRELEDMAEAMGPQYMHEFLSALDPAAAERIHPNNTRKVVRAIEAFETGSRVHSLEDCELNTDYEFHFYGITMERDWLYERINKRVVKLVKAGLIDEVRGILAKGFAPDCPALRAIGYKEIISYINGEIDLKEAILLVMKNSRRYAKRQQTWFKRYDGMINWVEIHKKETVGAVIDEILKIDAERYGS